MIAATVTAIIAIYAVARIVLEKETLRKFTYLNVMNFAIAATIPLVIADPLAMVAAVAYFVGSTLESNAIASAYAVRRDGK
jgi:energy-converting hydrogenase A subunit C